MILLGIKVDVHGLSLSVPERTALSILSTAIIAGECVCGGTWEDFQDSEGVVYPAMTHMDGCPGTSKTGQEAVRKVIRHVIYSTLAADTEEDD
jgi:hypothetical protein